MARFLGTKLRKIKIQLEIEKSMHNLSELEEFCL